MRMGKLKYATTSLAVISAILILIASLPGAIATEDADWIIQENIYGEENIDNNESDDGSSSTTSSSGDHLSKKISDSPNTSKTFTNNTSNLTSSDPNGSNISSFKNNPSKITTTIPQNISKLFSFPDSISSEIKTIMKSSVYNETSKNSSVSYNSNNSNNATAPKTLSQKRNTQYKYKRKEKRKNYNHDRDNYSDNTLHLLNKYDRDNDDVLKHLPNNISSLINNKTNSIVKSEEGLFLKTNKTYVIPLRHIKLNKTAKSVIKDSVHYGMDLLFSTKSSKFHPLNSSDVNIKRKNTSSVQKVLFTPLVPKNKAKAKSTSISQYDTTYNQTTTRPDNKTYSKTKFMDKDSISTNEEMNNKTMPTIMMENKTPSLPSNTINTINKKNKTKKLGKQLPVTNHEKDLVKVIKLSKSESTSRHRNDRNFRDTVLKLNKHFGKTHRIVLDYSQGEENARLLIYLHNSFREDVLSKRSKIEKVSLHKKDDIVVEESAEKRMIGSFGINRWAYFGINGDFKRYSIPKQNESESNRDSIPAHEEVSTNTINERTEIGGKTTTTRSKTTLNDENEEENEHTETKSSIYGNKNDKISNSKMAVKIKKSEPARTVFPSPRSRTNDVHRVNSKTVVPHQHISAVVVKPTKHSEVISQRTTAKKKKIIKQVKKGIEAIGKIQNYLLNTAAATVKQKNDVGTLDHDTPYVHYIRQPTRPHIPFDILNHYLKPAVRHIPVDKDTPYVHYIRPSVPVTAPIAAILNVVAKRRHKASTHKKKAPPPPVHKVIDVSAYDNDDDDDDDDDNDSNSNLLLYQKENHSGLNRKEEAIYKQYVKSKQEEDDENIDVGNSNLREKKAIMDSEDGEHMTKRDNKDDDEEETDESSENKSDASNTTSNDEDDDDIGSFVKKIAKEINVGKHASELVPQSVEEESGSKRMVPIRALDALYKSHKFPNEPDLKEVLDRFDAPTKVGYQYGQLIWGWFIAPLDGEYVFYSSCDDACDIYMSPDEGKDHIRKVISQNRWSLHNQWDKYPEEQTSMGIRLAGGRAYYIQAVGAQSGGRDCLSVGVQLPTGVMVKPITRHFLTRSPIGPGGRFRMSPALAAAQKADIQASILGFSGPLGSSNSFGLTPSTINSIGAGSTGLGGEARNLDQILNAGSFALQQQQQLLMLQQQQQQLQQQLQQQQQLGSTLGASNLGGTNLGSSLGASNLGSLSSLTASNNAGLSAGLTPVQQPGIITSNFFGSGGQSHGESNNALPGSPLHVAAEARVGGSSEGLAGAVVPSGVQSSGGGSKSSDNNLGLSSSNGMAPTPVNAGSDNNGGNSGLSGASSSGGAGGSNSAEAGDKPASSDDDGDILSNLAMLGDAVSVLAAERDGRDNAADAIFNFEKSMRKADAELISSIAKLGDTVSGLAAKVADKEKAIERAKQTAMVGATLSKLDKAIDAISTRMDSQAVLNAMQVNPSAANNNPAVSASPSNNIAAGLLAGLSGSTNGGLGPGVGNIASGPGPGSSGAGFGGLNQGAMLGTTSSNIAGISGLNNGAATPGSIAAALSPNGIASGLNGFNGASQGLGGMSPSLNGVPGGQGILGGNNQHTAREGGVGGDMGKPTVSENTKVSPELFKLESNVGGLAEKIDAIAEKIERGNAPEPVVNPALAAQQEKINEQLRDMGLAIGKLAGKVEGIKSHKQNKDKEIDHVLGDVAKTDKAESDIAKVLGYLQRKESRSPLKQVADGYQQSLADASAPPPPPDSSTAAAILASATVNQALNAIKTAAKATGLSGTALGTAITSKQPSADATTRQLIELIKAASKPEKNEKVSDEVRSKNKESGTNNEKNEVGLDVIKNASLKNDEEKATIETHTVPEVAATESAPMPVAGPPNLPENKGPFTLSQNRGPFPIDKFSGTSSPNIQVSMPQLDSRSSKSFENSVGSIMSGLLDANTLPKDSSFFQQSSLNNEESRQNLAFGHNGLTKSSPLSEFHDWTNDPADGLRRNENPYSDSESSMNIMNYLANGDVSNGGMPSMDFAGNLPVGNQLLDQNVMTGVARSLMTSSGHPLPNQIPNRQNTIDAELLRNYYRNNAEKQDQTHSNSLDPNSLKSAATVETLLRSMNQNTLTSQGLSADTLTSGNLYNLLPANAAASVPHPSAQQEVSTTNRLPPNFANLLMSSHADDLLKSLEETTPDQDSASLQGSASILDLLASLRSNTASKRQFVTRYKNRNLTALLLQKIKKASLPRYQHRNTLPRGAFYESIHTKQRLTNDSNIIMKKDKLIQQRGERDPALPSTKRNIVPVLDVTLSNNTLCDGDVDGDCNGDTSVNRLDSLEDSNNQMDYLKPFTGKQANDTDDDNMNTEETLESDKKKKRKKHRKHSKNKEAFKKDNTNFNGTLMSNQTDILILQPLAHKVAQSRTEENLPVTQPVRSGAPPAVQTPANSASPAVSVPASTLAAVVDQKKKEEKEDEDRIHSFEQSVTNKLLDAVLAEKLNKKDAEEDKEAKLGRIYPLLKNEKTPVHDVRKIEDYVTPKSGKGFQENLTNKLLQIILNKNNKEKDENKDQTEDIGMKKQTHKTLE